MCLSLAFGFRRAFQLPVMLPTQRRVLPDLRSLILAITLSYYACEFTSTCRKNLPTYAEMCTNIWLSRFLSQTWGQQAHTSSCGRKERLRLSIPELCFCLQIFSVLKIPLPMFSWFFIHVFHIYIMHIYMNVCKYVWSCFLIPRL